jgi:hypothetical protein
MHQTPEFTPPTADEITPVCLGVTCHLHGTCLRYHAVDFAPANRIRIYFCGPTRDLYLPTKAAIV